MEATGRPDLLFPTWLHFNKQVIGSLLHFSCVDTAIYTERERTHAFLLAKIKSVFLVDFLGKVISQQQTHRTKKEMTLVAVRG